MTRPPKEPDCRLREILKTRLRADRQVYIDALTNLQERSGQDLVKADKRADRARLAYEVAKKKHGHHIAIHGCDEHLKYTQ